MDQNLWEKCVAFHGHECGGLTIGYKAALYAAKLLGLEFSGDEEVVCISENDACGIDAIQVLLGCSMGKGNLLFHLVGKQAFSFYDRRSGKSLRLVLKPRPQGMSREQTFAYYQELAPEEMFDVKEPRLPMPGKAEVFESFICDGCGEQTGGKWIRVRDGRNLCPDCFEG
ncbi:MAG: formylmethanofuran dehydrogenase [Firmicutes bacterium]|nr:formylmethanofuran dehydrogenase [Bacillota bacterium]